MTSQGQWANTPRSGERARTEGPEEPKGDIEMKRSQKLTAIFLALSALLLTACTDAPPETSAPMRLEATECPTREEPQENAREEAERGPAGFRMIHLTEEARDIALADFDYLVEIILENAPTQGIIYRRMGVTVEEFFERARDHIYEMRPMESFTSLIIDERWEEIPDDPLYLAADYLTTFLLWMSAFDLDGIGHFGPQSLESYEFMFLGNSVILHDPEEAEFTGDIRNIERIIGYFSAPATLWLYGTDPSEFDLTTDLSDLGPTDEDNITIEILEPGRIAYIHIASFLNSPAFDSEVLFPFYEEVQDFEHLIIDIRGNMGGWADYVISYVVGMLIDEPLYFHYHELITSGERALRAATYLNPAYHTRMSIAELLEERDLIYLNEDDLAFLTYAIRWYVEVEPDEENIPFGGKIWLLVDAFSASASEIFAQLSLYSGFATVVGEPTAGVTGVMTTFVSLPQTGVLFRVDTGSKIDAQGRAIEEFGIQPDILIAPGEDALAVVLASLGTAHAGVDPETAIVGRWECLDDTFPHGWMCLFIFEENGRFADRDGDGGTFTISGNSLTLEFDDFYPLTVTFHIRSNQLTLSGEYLHVVLTRQDSDSDPPRRGALRARE